MLCLFISGLLQQAKTPTHIHHNKKHKVINAHPSVLSYSVSERLQPFWDYLANIGVEDVGAAVASRPSLLGLTVDGSLKKIVDYLLYVGTGEKRRRIMMMCCGELGAVGVCLLSVWRTLRGSGWLSCC